VDQGSNQIMMQELFVKYTQLKYLSLLLDLKIGYIDLVDTYSLMVVDVLSNNIYKINLTKPNNGIVIDQLQLDSYNDFINNILPTAMLCESIDDCIANAIYDYQSYSHTGMLTNINDMVSIRTSKRRNVVFQLIHTAFTGTIIFEATVDNSGVWTPIFGYVAGTGQSSTTFINPTSGSVFRCTVAGFTQVRIRLLGVGSGSTNIVTSVTNETSGVFLNFPLPIGNNTIGSINQAGTWNITDITGTVSLPTGASTETTLLAANNNLDEIALNTDKLDVDLSTRLSEVDFDNRIGEVQLNPTDYTVLGRLKDIVDRLGDITVVSSGDVWQVMSSQSKAFITTTSVVIPSQTAPIFLLKNPSTDKIMRVKSIHITSTDEENIIFIYKNGTITSNGTYVAINNLKDLAISSSMLVYRTPTTSSYGTKLIESVNSDEEFFVFNFELALYINPGENLLVVGKKGNNSNSNGTVTVMFGEELL